MHVYIRWYEKGGLITQPERKESEAAAKSAILERFPTASFSQRIDSLNQPNCMLAGIGTVVYAWPGAPVSGVQPIADILFPV